MARPRLALFTALLVSAGAAAAQTLPIPPRNE